MDEVIGNSWLRLGTLKVPENLRDALQCFKKAIDVLWKEGNAALPAARLRQIAEGLKYSLMCAKQIDDSTAIAECHWIIDFHHVVENSIAAKRILQAGEWKASLMRVYVEASQELISRLLSARDAASLARAKDVLEKVLVFTSGGTAAGITSLSTSHVFSMLEDRALVAASQRDYQGALAHLEQALETLREQPAMLEVRDAPRTMFNMGVAHLLLADHAQAQRSFETALSLYMRQSEQVAAVDDLALSNHLAYDVLRCLLGAGNAAGLRQEHRAAKEMLAAAVDIALDLTGDATSPLCQKVYKQMHAQQEQLEYVESLRNLGTGKDCAIEIGDSAEDAVTAVPQPLEPVYSWMHFKRQRDDNQNSRAYEAWFVDARIL